MPTTKEKLPKNTKFTTIQIGEDLAAAIDRYASEHVPPISRAVAGRYLIELGLKEKTRRR